MTGSGRATLAVKHGSFRGKGRVEPPTRAEENGERGSDRGQLSARDPLLLGEFGVISRFGQEQQVQVVQQLQHSHGNREVARAITQFRVPSTTVSPSLQRAPATAPHQESAQKETTDDYINFLQGIDDLVTAAPKGHGSALGGVAFGSPLSDQHLGLLEELRTALMLVYESRKGASHDALDVWESIQGNLWAELRRASKIVHHGVRELDDMIGKDLSWIDKQFIRPAAYWEAHREALAHSDLQAPDLVAQQKLLDREEEELEQAKDLSEEAGKLAGEGIAAAVLKDADMGKEIFELVTVKGTIQEKLEKAKEKGIVEQAATAVDLVSKIAGLKTTILKTTFELLKGRAKRLAAEALEKGAEEVAKHWDAMAEGYEDLAGKLKTVGTVIGIIGAATDAIRAFSAALKGDWDEAVSKAANAGIGILGALGAEGSAPLLGAIVIGVKVELAAMHMAAEFIRWCRDETVRQAANEFIKACAAVAHYPAQDFVADAGALLDPSNANIRDLITKQLDRYTPDMRKGFAYIGNEVQCGEQRCLGGHPDLVQALGPQALRVLTEPYAFPDDPLSMAEEIHWVFAGANAMAKYVQEHYPQDKHEEKKANGGEGKAD